MIIVLLAAGVVIAIAALLLVAGCICKLGREF